MIGVDKIGQIRAPQRALRRADCWYGWQLADRVHDAFFFFFFFAGSLGCCASGCWASAFDAVSTAQSDRSQR
jgi:hypothetical protein